MNYSLQESEKKEEEEETKNIPYFIESFLHFHFLRDKKNRINGDMEVQSVRRK